RPMRDSVSSSSSRRSGSSSMSSTLGCPRYLRSMGVLLFTYRFESALHRHSEMGPRAPRQKLQCGAVRVAAVARDVESHPRAAGTRWEEGLEYLAAKVRRNAGAVVGKLADDRVAHVAGSRGDPDAAFLL